MVNLFDIAGKLPDSEIFDLLFRNDKILIQRIISSGQCSPPGFWYEEDKDEWVLLLQGEAVISYQDGQTVNLQVGDYLFLPAKFPHRVDKTSLDPPCIWLAIYF